MYVTCAVFTSRSRICKSRKGKVMPITWGVALSTASRVCDIPDLPNSKKSAARTASINDWSNRVTSIHMDSSSRVSSTRSSGDGAEFILCGKFYRASMTSVAKTRAGAHLPLVADSRDCGRALRTIRRVQWLFSRSLSAFNAASTRLRGTSNAPHFTPIPTATTTASISPL